MIKQITRLIALLIMASPQATAANEDGSSSNRYLKYVCNGETHIIASTDTGWTSLSHPKDVTVETTHDGFWLANRKTGIERSLGKSASGADVMYVYYADGTKRYACVYTRDNE